MAMMPVVMPPSPVPMPMPVVPVTMVPMTVMPVTAVMPPADLLRLEMIDFVLCNDCRFYTGVAPGRESLLRQSW